MKRAVIPIVRLLKQLRRPSSAANRRRLQARGESVAAIDIREATPADIPALAELHVATFRETHGGGPTIALRASQYEQKFAGGGEWFCVVAVRADGALVGFAVGEPGEPSGGAGHVDKIYVRSEYQRLGLGRRLLEQVARRFVRDGRTAMTLFSQADNPSIAFFDASGGERLLNAAGGFDGGYRWPDIRNLAARSDMV
jgi:ribosomal protein S18 acetylase RimI-like enzyme